MVAVTVTEGALHTELTALAAFADVLEGSGRPLVISSATGLLTHGRLGTETDGPDPAALGAHRGEAERAALALAGRGVRVSAIRLPASVGRGVGTFQHTVAIIHKEPDRAASRFSPSGRPRSALPADTGPAIPHTLGSWSSGATISMITRVRPVQR